ncbi:hypothetical protein CDL15_Pgr002935 [Punica granatum]|uniref:Phosphatidylglycerophosphatase GEP4, mitochondrial n=2 Tax=Punica granatum TaxID=22663 RepID=A0A218X1E2_PUNGR|nr:hypothetical protein CDL15_Pgr002935 [Punica granatum]
MQSTPIAAASASCSSCYPIPNLLFHHRPGLKLKPPTIVSLSLPASRKHLVSSCSLHLATTTVNSSSQEQEDTPHRKPHNPPLLPQFRPPSDAESTGPECPEDQTRQAAQQASARRRVRKSSRRGICTSMWWADLKGAFGQRFNWEGIVCSMAVFTRDRHLALPHVSVSDVRYIDWAELRRRGFKGVVFDKDNTITAPYCLTLWGPIGPSIDQCKSVFGPNIAVFSNSAGLLEYDHDGSKAKALEWAVGIKVIRHRVKKPAGNAEEIEKHFGCDSSQLIMVGDRPFTDIVYGNRNGFLTILTAPLSPTEEPFIVRQVRKLENSFVSYWSKRGLKPISHGLLPDTKQCVKDP